MSDILYEFIYTMCQSGSRHDRPATPEELEKNPDHPVIVQGEMIIILIMVNIVLAGPITGRRWDCRCLHLLL